MNTFLHVVSLSVCKELNKILNIETNRADLFENHFNTLKGYFGELRIKTYYIENHPIMVHILSSKLFRNELLL